MIPYGRQDVTQDDIDAVISVLKSDFLTQGPVVPAFEDAIAEKVGALHAVAVNSATSALHIACLALGVGPGDWVWTSPITFVASANCALYCGARVDFVDIDPRTYNIAADALASKLEDAARHGLLPKVVVVVHLCGQPCDMAAIAQLADKYNFKIIEDASHAIGGRYRGEPIGSGQHSDITVFSFHPVKIITSAEGGMAVTNDPKLARAMQMLRSHGITRDPALMQDAADGAWAYEQLTLGFNYRLTDLQAALGLSQTARIDQYVATRFGLARRYESLLADLPIGLPWQHPDSYSAWHLYVVRLRLDELELSQRQIFDSMRAGGIGVNLHYIPVYRQPYFRAMGFRRAAYPEAESYYAEAITLPLFPSMTEAQQDEVASVLHQVIA
jgi:UDP-4-amino-4,6-dideoxy-N-acetyl-beta-L-altrosamine transaminase